jgi:hypothetical protein
MQRRHAALVLATLLITALTLGAAELLVRATRPNPRVQVLRPESFAIELVDGEPLWTLPGPYADALRNEACSGDLHVWIAADSTLYVLGPGEAGLHPVPDEPALHAASALLQQRLSTPERAVCVHNLSVPAYGPAQQLRAVQRAAADHRLDLLIFGVWKPDNRFTRVGESWYPFTQYEADTQGFPRPLGLTLPASLHRALLPRSRLYELGLLALGTPDDDDYRIDAYEQAMDWSRAHAVPTVLVELPSLSTPFEEQARARPPHGYPRVQAAAEARGVPYVVLAAELTDHQPESLRTDRCCHYNAHGHEVIAERLAELTTPHLPP